MRERRDLSASEDPVGARERRLRRTPWLARAPATPGDQSSAYCVFSPADRAAAAARVRRALASVMLSHCTHARAPPARSAAASQQCGFRSLSLISVGHFWMDFVRQNIDQMSVQSDIKLQMLIAAPDDTISRIDLQLLVHSSSHCTEHSRARESIHD